MSYALCALFDSFWGSYLLLNWIGFGEFLIDLVTNFFGYLSKLQPQLRQLGIELLVRQLHKREGVNNGCSLLGLWGSTGIDCRSKSYVNAAHVGHHTTHVWKRLCISILQHVLHTAWLMSLDEPFLTKL